MSVRRCRTHPDVEWLEDRSVPSILGLGSPISAPISSPVLPTAQQLIRSPVSTGGSLLEQSQSVQSLVTSPLQQVASSAGSTASTLNTTTASLLTTLTGNVAGSPLKTVAPLATFSPNLVVNPSVLSQANTSAILPGTPGSPAVATDPAFNMAENPLAIGPSSTNFTTTMLFTTASQTGEDSLLSWLEADGQSSLQGSESSVVQPAAINTTPTANTLQLRQGSAGNSMTANGGTTADQAQPAPATGDDAEASTDGDGWAVANDAFAQRDGIAMGSWKHHLTGHLAIPLSPLANFIPRILLPSLEGQRPMAEQGQEPAEVDWVTVSSWGLLLTAAAAAHAVATRQARPEIPLVDMHGDWTHGPH